MLGAAGGVGLAAIEIGKAIGATRHRLRLERRQARGLHAARRRRRHQLRHRGPARAHQGAHRRQGRGRGLRRGRRPLHASPRCARIAWRGRLLVVGFAAGDIPKIPLNLALLKGCSIVGVFWGDFARREPKAFAESIAPARRTGSARASCKPHVSQTFPLAKAVEALKLMAARKVKGKVVLTVGLVPSPAPSGQLHVARCRPSGRT